MHTAAGSARTLAGPSRRLAVACRDADGAFPLPGAPQPVFFDPRPLTNLELLDRLDSLAPITDMKVGGCGGLELLRCGSMQPCVPGRVKRASGCVKGPSNCAAGAGPLSPLPRQMHCSSPNNSTPGGQPGQRGDPADLRRVRARRALHAARAAPRPRRHRRVHAPAAVQAHGATCCLLLAGMDPSFPRLSATPAEMAVSPLPGNPTAVWTVKKAVSWLAPSGCPWPAAQHSDTASATSGASGAAAWSRSLSASTSSCFTHAPAPLLPSLPSFSRQVSDEFDAYIVVSFSNATLVLRCGSAWAGSARGRVCQLGVQPSAGHELHLPQKCTQRPSPLCAAQ